ncbi:MAG: glycosyltransferase [Sarcina sp.]
MKILFWISLIAILHTFILYPITLFVMEKFFSKKSLDNDININKKVSLIVVAHNEEKVIEKKLENLMDLDYKIENLEIIVSSDNSDDATNKIVENFITTNKNKFNIILYKVKERKGKTNAQDEAVRIANGEIIVMTDANAMLDSQCVKELVQTLNNENVGYVCGELKYVNALENITSLSENNYWSYDLWMREKESNMKSITAGNGALYAVKKVDYKNIDPIYSHDSMFPIMMNLSGKESKYNKKAIAFEKAGEYIGDEFKRKVRMARKNIKITFSNLGKYNPFKVGLFSYFYFSHRMLRNILWILHLVLFFSNFALISDKYYFLIFLGQIIFCFLAFIGKFVKNKIISMFRYYTITLIAQYKGFINEVTGKSKATWEKAESTR